MLGLEESPDTAVRRLTRLDWRATRLVTPGGRVCEDSATDSATENKPPAQLAVSASEPRKPRWQAGGKPSARLSQAGCAGQGWNGGV